MTLPELSLDSYWLTKAELEQVLSIIESGDIVQGKEVEGFEREFAAFIGSRYAIACNSGTSALHIALAACGLMPKKEVITTPLSFVATANAILYCNARPVFADINAATLNISADSVKKKVRADTAALIGVHLYGYPYDVKAIQDACGDNVVMIEDCAQALGATYGGRKVGLFGKAGIFSFYDTKHLKLGEGGMIVTDDESVAEKCRMIRSHGSRKQYVHEMLGYNYRLNEIFAKIGRIQLKKVDRIIDGKKKRAKMISEYMAPLSSGDIVRCLPDSQSVYYRFPLILKNPAARSRVLDAVAKKVGRILTTGYPTVIYEQLLYKEITSRLPMARELGLSDYTDRICPVAEGIPSKIIEIPTDPWLPEQELVSILEVCKKELA